MFDALENILEREELEKTAITAERLCSTLQCDVFRVLVRLLRTYVVEIGNILNIARHKDIHLTKSAYVSGCKAPTLNDLVVDEFVKYDDDGWGCAKSCHDGIVLWLK